MKLSAKHRHPMLIAASDPTGSIEYLGAPGSRMVNWVRLMNNLVAKGFFRHTHGRYEITPAGRLALSDQGREVAK